MIEVGRTCSKNEILLIVDKYRTKLNASSTKRVKMQNSQCGGLQGMKGEEETMDNNRSLS